MPGAGSAELAFGIETAYRGAVEDADGTDGPDYYGFGRDPTLTGPSVEQNLSRKRDGRSVESQYSAEGNVQTRLSVESDAHAASFSKILAWVFNSDGGSFDGTQRPTSARVYTASQNYDGTVTRTPVGVVPESLTLSWAQGDLLRYSLSLVGADEREDVSKPSNITEAEDKGEVPFHSAELSIDAAVQTKLQSWDLKITDIATLRYGNSRTATDARLVGPQESLSMTAAFNDGENVDAAYGGASQSSVADSLSSVPATISLTTAAGANLATLHLEGLKPATYSWEQLVSKEDTTESVDWHVNGVTVT